MKSILKVKLFASIEIYMTVLKILRSQLTMILLFSTKLQVSIVNWKRPLYNRSPKVNSWQSWAPAPTVRQDLMESHIHTWQDSGRWLGR